MDDNIFMKRIDYKEKCREALELEIELQRISSKYGFTPTIINVIFNQSYCDIYMTKINEMCLADKYGDNPENISISIWNEIKKIINILYECEGIEYIDITPYNFIEYNNKLFIIDFGHATYKDDKKDRNWFHKEFLEDDGYKAWNEDFK